MKKGQHYCDDRIKLSTNFLGSLVITDVPTAKFIIFRDWEGDWASTVPGVRTLRSLLSVYRSGTHVINDIEVTVEADENHAHFLDTRDQTRVDVGGDAYLALLTLLSAYYD